MSALGRRLAPVVAALAAAGCATSRQCAIPEAPLAPPPGPPLAARVGVAFPDGLDLDALPVEIGDSAYRFPTGPAAVAALDRAVAQLFERPVPARLARPIAGGPEAVLSFTLDEARVFPGPFRAEAAEVKLTGVLRDARGEVARATASARAEGQPVHLMGLVHCDAAGSALGTAIAQATSRLRDDLHASPAVAAWAADPVRVPLPEASDPPLVPPPQPAAGEGERRRIPVVPRFYELSLAYGSGSGSGPGLSQADGWGFCMRFGWDVGEYVALGFHAADSFVTVDWTPDPSQPRDSAENGFFGVEAMVRFRPGQAVRPWIAATLAYQGVTWDHYLHSVGGWGLLGSAGVDVATGSFGWLRLGLSATGYGATTSSINSTGFPTPAPGDDGTAVHMTGVWLTVGWVLDLGPPP